MLRQLWTRQESDFGSHRGFTLIELLVVFAIITILISIGAASYSTTLKRGRDSQRKSDLKKIQSALESFYSDNNAYPDEADSDKLSCSTNGTDRASIDSSSKNWGADFTCGSTTYLGKIPADPTSGRSYIYEVYEDPTNTPPGWCQNSFGTACQHYALWAPLENSNDSDRYQDSGDEEQCYTVYNSSADNSWVPSSPAWYCVHD